MIKYKDEYRKIECGMMSLIGAMGKRPLSWGNYFSLRNGPSILNMWWENLEDAKEKFLSDGKVKIRNYGRCAIIIDERIPQEYFYNKCCFTGAAGVSEEIAKDIYEKLGDPTNEYLQFTDRKKYHEQRGQTYTVVDSPEFGKFAIIGSKVNATASKLKDGWTIEEKELESDFCLGYKGSSFKKELEAEMDSGIVFAPYIPTFKKLK